MVGDNDRAEGTLPIECQKLTMVPGFASMLCNVYWRCSRLKTECVHTMSNDSAIKLYGVGTCIVLTKSTGVMRGPKLLGDSN